MKLANLEEFKEALFKMEEERRVPHDLVIETLKDSMARAYRKELGQDDANIKVEIDLDNGVIDMFEVKIVKKDVEDDFLEIELAEAKKENKDYKEGDEYLIPVDINALRRATLMSFKTIMKQKFSQIEKDQLNEEFKGKLQTIVTGRVEKMDEKGATVNIGRSTVYLTRKQMIGDEVFEPLDTIKVYINEVATGKTGAHIIVSRSCPGFLEKLFEEEIHDVYDKTITIKAIAREAGARSKVAVYCADPQIDACSTCIGKSGSRIQKIVNQLGNGTSKEKIDVIAYSEIPGLFIAEALKPAKVVGVDVDEENHSALVVVEDDSYSLAIGRKGINSRLAAKLTGYSIDIVVEKEAQEEGFEYELLPSLVLKDQELRATKRSNELAKEFSRPVSVPGVPEGYVAPQERVYSDTKNDFDEVLEEKVEEEISTETIETSVNKEETKAQEVKTTVSLEDLEKSLASSKDTKEKRSYKRNNKVEKKEEEEEAPVITKVAPEQRMAIYTEEEEKEFELEDQIEEEVEDDDVDYDDYDEYYDK